MSEVEQAIAASKIKVRWEEPYVSEASNRQFTAIPPGLYRGGYVVPTSPDSQSIKIVPDDGSGIYSDTFIVVFDKTNGFGVTVLDPDEVVVDLSSWFPGGVVAVPTTLYVCVELDYATSNETTGRYFVTDVAQPDGYAVGIGGLTLATITLGIGDTEVEASNISQSTTAMPVPSPEREDESGLTANDRILGLLSSVEAWRVPSLDQKKAMNNAPTTPDATNPFVTKADTMDIDMAQPAYEDVTGLSAVTKVQLSGWFYVGDGAAGTAQRFFTLETHGEDNRGYPLVVTGDDSKAPYVGAIYKNDDSAELNPSSDSGVDDNGFYQNPYVYFFYGGSPYSYSGDLSIRCLRKAQLSTLEQEPATPFPFAALTQQLATNRIPGRAESGTPDNMAAGTLDAQLLALLGLINGRIKTVHPTASSSSWILLWASNNNGSDYETTRIYWRDQEFAILINGTFSSDTEITSGGTTATDTRLWLLSTKTDNTGGLIRAVRRSGASDVFAYGDRNNWDHWFQEPTIMSGLDDEIVPLISIFKSGAASLDFPLNFYAGKPWGKGFAITFNSAWDASANKWTGNTLTGDAWALFVGEYGIRLCCKDDATTPWVNADWSSQVDLLTNKETIIEPQTDPPTGKWYELFTLPHGLRPTAFYNGNGWTFAINAKYNNTTEAWSFVDDNDDAYALVLTNSGVQLYSVKAGTSPFSWKYSTLKKAEAGTMDYSFLIEGLVDGGSGLIPIDHPSSGMLIVNADTAGGQKTGIYRLEENNVALISGDSAVFTAVSGTPGRINIYESTGYRLQNNYGETLDIVMGFFGTSPF